MSGRHFDNGDNAELRAKIGEAKQRLPLPKLMRELNYNERNIRKSGAVCPFHSDEHPSFSVFRGDDGFWHWNCFAGCGEGDEIALLEKHSGITRREAIKRYLEMAGFPARVIRKSREYPESRQSHRSPEFPECPESPMSPVSLMSKGKELEKALKELAARDACNERITVKKVVWELARDVCGLQKQIGKKLTNSEREQVLDEWYRLSQPSLDRTKSRDYYFAAFLAKLPKVRRPKGEKSDILNEALAVVLKLSPDELPVIPAMPNAPESWRRILALHRELSRRSARKDKMYFLTCRSAAKVVPGMSHQEAWNIHGVLADEGVIKLVRAGNARPGGKGSQYLYLLSQEPNGGAEIAA